MKQYQEFLKTILKQGTWQANRTGIDTITIPGHMMKFDLAEGFPAVTTKKLFFSAVKGELIGFMRGYDNAADFRKLYCNIWNANANDPGQPGAPNRWLTSQNRKGEDDLGRIYGVQWRKWRGRALHVGENGRVEYEEIDQLQNAVDLILNDPTNRRIIITAWRPDEFDQMALPPCHVLYQFWVNVERRELNLCMYQRSVDSMIGCPFNIASASLLLSIVAKLTGYTPRYFNHFMADCHIYRNHLEQVDTLLQREPFPLPKLVLSDNFNSVDNVEVSDIQLFDYQHHPEIKAEMAV